MNRAVLILGGCAVGGLAWYLSARAETLDEVAEVVEESAAAVVETVGQAADYVSEGFGFMKISNMKMVNPEVLRNFNVQAMLRVIRNAEGTADAGGYNRLFGGGSFDGYADHPRRIIKLSGYTSTAAGAYQFKASTWDETRQMMGLRDFSPSSQDLGAVGRIAARRALDDVIAGRFEQAIQKINKEWASLPGSPYGQPVVTMERARGVFLAHGGNDIAGSIG